MLKKLIALPFIISFYFLFIAACHDKQPDILAVDNGLRPVEPENALATFELEPGFRMELVASEPLVSDAVDREIDEYGRMYVVEMHGYPLDISGTGKIKLLSDNDGDGKMDSSTVFAEGLTMQ